jgi:hypothetical protein
LVAIARTPGLSQSLGSTSQCSDVIPKDFAVETAASAQSPPG